METIFLCKYCNKRSKNSNSHKNHERCCPANANRIYISRTQSKDGHIAWNKGLTKDTDIRVKKNAESAAVTIRKKVASGIWVSRQMGPDARKRLSMAQSLNNRGGKSKWFDYKGQKLQGTWELNVARKLDELNILWYKPKVNNDVLTYVLDGKVKSYTPDFYLPEYNVYLEIKGYWWGNDKAKMNAVIQQHQDKRIVIVEKAEYNKILQGELVW